MAVLSMLHEPSDRNSATRRFRDRPVLWWTLQRLSRASRVDAAVILCWDDQADAARGVADPAGVEVIARGQRQPIPHLDAVAAARRWSDGWRGGLLSTCDFDLGFHAAWARDAAAPFDAAGVLLVDPAAGLVDPELVDVLIDHAAAHDGVEVCFAPAAPGLCGALLRPPLLDRLAAAGAHPGRLMHYHPDQVSREPLAGESCAPVPTPVARTTQRFTLSSDRQVQRVAAAVAGLNGQLIETGGEALVRLAEAAGAVDPLPREVVLELNTNRLSRPIYWPGRHPGVARPDLSPDDARALFAELGGTDDRRLTLAGVGDPLLHPGVFDLVDAAKAAGLAVHVETDLLGPDAEAVRRLAGCGVDVVSVHLPALTPQTYAAVMGVDGYRTVLENIQAFVTERAVRRSGVPLLVPTFTKCRDNLAEMEPWYDQWLRAVGSAVITGASDYAKLIADVAAADMAPPSRRPCARLASRATVLSDGRIVSCEQDVLGRQAVGRVGERSLAEVWRGGFGALRSSHRLGKWNESPTCAACREWHRP